MAKQRFFDQNFRELNGNHPVEKRFAWLAPNFSELTEKAAGEQDVEEHCWLKSNRENEVTRYIILLPLAKSVTQNAAAYLRLLLRRRNPDCFINVLSTLDIADFALRGVGEIKGCRTFTPVNDRTGKRSGWQFINEDGHLKADSGEAPHDLYVKVSIPKGFSGKLDLKLSDEDIAKALKY